MLSAHILAPYHFVSHELDRRLTRAVYAMAHLFLSPVLGVLVAVSQHMT